MERTVVDKQIKKNSLRSIWDFTCGSFRAFFPEKSRRVPRLFSQSVENCEPRCLLTVNPVTLSDPSVWGIVGNGGAPNPATAAYGGTLNSVSADGNLVTFSSNVFYGKTTSDLAPDVTFSSTNSLSHAFVRNVDTGAVQVVDLAPNGTAVGGMNPIITPDGRYVVFEGFTSTLVPGITYTGGNSTANVFVRDLQTNTTKLVSVDNSGTHDVPTGGGMEYAISDDGRYVAFTSDSATPLPGISNPNRYHVILMRDLVAGTTVLVSHDLSDDGQIRGNSSSLSTTGDGRYVLFVSLDANLAAGDNNSAEDIFRWDRTTGQVALVSVNNAGTGTANLASGHEEHPVMTSDGRHIFFSSRASNLEPPHSLDKGYRDIFSRDMGDGVTAPSTQAVVQGTDGDSYAPAITPDGSEMAFISTATLVPPPAPKSRLASGKNVFVFGATGVQLVSVNSAHNDSGNDVSGGPGTDGFGNNAPLITRDGGYVVYYSWASDLLPNFADGNLGGDLYLYNVQQGTNQLITYNMSGTTSGNKNQQTDHAFISADGGTLVFDSQASDLVLGDGNSQPDVFDFTIGGTSQISGQVFADLNGNGVNDGEAGLGNWTVFVDLNRNGFRDPGEVSALTDSAGRYVLNGLRAGDYKLLAVPQQDFRQTLPAAGSSPAYAFNLAQGASTSGRDFGEILDPNQAPDVLDGVFTIDENSPIGSAVGTVIASDPNPTDLLIYSIIDGNVSGAFSMNSSTGLISIANSTVLDFETTPQFVLTVKVADNRGATSTAMVTIKLIDVIETPSLALTGGFVTWKNKSAPTTVLPKITVGPGNSLAGGTLQISVNAVGSGKKAIDKFQFPVASLLGTSQGPQYSNGKVTLQIELNSTTTSGAIISFLQGILFSTKGAGRKVATRNLNISLNIPGGQPSFLSQLIKVVK